MWCRVRALSLWLDAGGRGRRAVGMAVGFIGARSHGFLETARSRRKFRSTLAFRVVVILAVLSFGLMQAALAAPARAATGQRGASKRAGEKFLRIWAYFDGDTP